MAKRKSEEVPKNINTQLESERQEQGLSEPESLILDKLLDKNKKEDSKNNVTINKQLEKQHSDPKGHNSTESLLESNENDDAPKRDDNKSYSVIPNNSENVASEKKKEKAFNLKSYYESFSQLQNNPNRFNGNKVKDMVMASLKDADAMLYFIYHQANNEDRELNVEEKALIDGINSDKQKLIVYLLNEI